MQVTNQKCSRTRTLKNESSTHISEKSWQALGLFPSIQKLKSSMNTLEWVFSEVEHYEIFDSRLHVYEFCVEVRSKAQTYLRQN